MIRKLAVILAVVAAVLGGRAALAQEPPVPRFFIERIEVRNTDRVSPDVVVAESRLREGTEYSESDLRDAAARLNRLPFLLNADFALERGSERGKYILAITVTETRSFFFRLNLVPLYEQRNTLRGIDFDTQAGHESETDAALGYRWFLGRRGALHVAFSGRDSNELTRGYVAFVAGWTQYDLFGTRAFATINIKDSPEIATSPQLVVGIPLSLNQTLTAEYDELVLDFDDTDIVRGDDNDAQRLARVTWSYNTTNHPFVPTDGTLFSVGPIAAWRDDSVTFAVADGPNPRYERVPLHERALGIEASALRYWELSDRNSVYLGLQTRLGHVDSRHFIGDTRIKDSYSTITGIAQAGASRSLWSPERRAQGGDSRIELKIGARIRDNERYERAYQRDEAVQASVSWVRHSSWGTLRLGAGVLW